MSLSHAAVGLLAAAVVALSALPRILAAGGTLPRELNLFGWSDVLRTWLDPPLGGGRLPYLDVGFAYPPVIAYISGLLAAAIVVRHVALIRMWRDMLARTA